MKITRESKEVTMAEITTPPSEVAQENADAERKALEAWTDIICEAQIITKNFTLKHDVGLSDIAIKHISAAITAARGAESAAAREPSQERLLKVASECSIEAGIGIGQARLLELIGQPPEGSHPDEWKPRAVTWHQERLNWIAEVERLRAAARTTRRDGKWIDEMGACKVCDGEIPYGHTENCDIYKLEKRITELAAVRVEPATKELEEVATDSAGAITAFINMRERSGFRINSFEQASIGNIILRFLTQAIHNASLGATPKSLADFDPSLPKKVSDNLFRDSAPPAPGLPDKAGLLPCPFCGGKAIEGMFNVWCENCGAETNRQNTEATRDEIISSWNKRAPLTASPWIRTAERAPTEKDGDDLGDVFAIRFQPNGQIDKPKFRHWSGVVGFARLYPFWIPIPPLPASLPTKPTQ